MDNKMTTKEDKMYKSEKYKLDWDADKVENMFDLFGGEA